VRTYERDGCLSPIRLMSAERAQQRTCGILKHEEKDHPKSILARGQFITDAFKDSQIGPRIAYGRSRQAV
jgi:hypothetical protein